MLDRGGVVTTSMILGTYGDRIGVRKVLFFAHIIQGASLILAFLASGTYAGILPAFLE
jgi:hypothetical protein